MIIILFIDHTNQLEDYVRISSNEPHIQNDQDLTEELESKINQYESYNFVATPWLLNLLETAPEISNCKNSGIQNGVAVENQTLSENYYTNTDNIALNEVNDQLRNDEFQAQNNSNLEIKKNYLGIMKIFI